METRERHNSEISLPSLQTEDDRHGDDSDDPAPLRDSENNPKPFNLKKSMTKLISIVNHHGSEGSEQEVGDSEGEGIHADTEHHILENEVSSMLMNEKNQAGVERSHLEKTLLKLGFRLQDEELQQSTMLTTSGITRAAFGRRSVNSVTSVSMGLTPQLEHMFHMFPLDKQQYKMQPQHLGLPGVLKHVFVAQEDLLRRQASVPTGNSSSSFSSMAKLSVARLKRKLCGSGAKRITRCLRFVVNHPIITMISFLATLYTLLCPDLAVMSLDRRADASLLMINTVVFLMFFLELILIVAVRGDYILSLHFALDVVSILSLLTDTLFMASLSFDEGGTSISRLARSSRVARVARIGRVARLTKLVPRALKLCKKQSNALAEHLLLRRLWRLFQFLDTDRDGYISVFDAKMFYIALVMECRHVLEADPRYDSVKVLEMDMAKILQWGEQGEFQPSVDVNDFSQIIMEMEIGSHLKEFHRQDLESDVGSVWGLTQKLSDSTAMKVCVGILMLVAVMTLLEEDVLQDQSSSQALAHLDAVARFEHADVSPDFEHLCQQIKVYGEQNDLMFLYLDGWTHYDYDTCLRPGKGARRISLNEAVAHAQLLAEESFLRQNEYFMICWQPDQHFDCDSSPPLGFNSTATLALINSSKYTQESSFWNLMTIFAVLLQIPISVYMLNVKINTFSSTLLQPLRSLVDDMVAMQSLELVAIDDENSLTTKNGKDAFGGAEELANLNVAFKSMRSAIRSWSKFVPPSVVERFYDAGLEATIGVTRLEATALFCDIDGFEETCRDFSPQVVLSQLTGVLGTIADVIQLNHGTFLEFISDEVLAVFNAPNTLPNHASAGLACAVSIHEAVQSAHSLSGEAVRCRVGVHTALILAGNIGSTQRIKYGLLGDGINLAARLKGLNSKYRTSTLCSGQCLEAQLKALPLATRPIDVVAVKGKSEPTIVHEVLGTIIENPVLESGCLRHAEAFSLYQAREFEQARDKFQEANALMEMTEQSDIDHPSKLLCQRCEGYMENPPPDDWDGVEHLKSKSFGHEPASVAAKATPGAWKESKKKAHETAALQQFKILDTEENHTVPDDWDEVAPVRVQESVFDGCSILCRGDPSDDAAPVPKIAQLLPVRSCLPEVTAPVSNNTV